MPISRVRSVTDTSRMFMMPIPPTSSEIDAIAASSCDITWLAMSDASNISLMLRTVKSSSSPSAMRWRARSSAVTRSDSASDGGRVVQREDDLIHRAERLGPQDPALGGGEGHEHDVVLILPPARLALARQHADHAKRHVLHADGGVDRVLARAEQLVDHGLPEQRHLGAAVLLRLGERSARAHPPVADLEEARGAALHAGRPVAIAVRHLRDVALHPGDVGGVGQLARDRLGVADGERVDAARSRSARRRRWSRPASPSRCWCRGSRSAPAPRRWRPAPTLTMAITAATPITTPSAVRAERSGLRRKADPASRSVTRRSFTPCSVPAERPAAARRRPRGRRATRSPAPSPRPRPARASRRRW